MENNYEKVDKLLEVREQGCSRLKAVDAEIVAEKKVRFHIERMRIYRTYKSEKALLSEGTLEPETEDLWYLRRLDGGQFTMQTVDYILAWIAMEDDGVRLRFLPVVWSSNHVIPGPHPPDEDAEAQELDTR